MVTDRQTDRQTHKPSTVTTPMVHVQRVRGIAIRTVSRLLTTLYNDVIELVTLFTVSS